MRYNPETLKYKTGQKVVWKGKHGERLHGHVVNVAYWGLQVVQMDSTIQWIEFDSITTEA